MFILRIVIIIVLSLFICSCEVTVATTYTDIPLCILSSDAVDSLRIAAKADSILITTNLNDTSVVTTRVTVHIYSSAPGSLGNADSLRVQTARLMPYVVRAIGFILRYDSLVIAYTYSISTLGFGTTMHSTVTYQSKDISHLHTAIVEEEIAKEIPYIRLFEIEDYDSLQRLLEKNYHILDEHYRVYYYKAEYNYAVEKNYATATQYYSMLHNEHPYNTIVCMRLCNLALLRDDFHAAEQYARWVRRLDSRHVKATIMLGQLMLHKGDSSQALRFFENIRKSGSNDADTYIYTLDSLGVK